jgi:hypothetical protein
LIYVSPLIRRIDKLIQVIGATPVIGTEKPRRMLDARDVHQRLFHPRLFVYCTDGPKHKTERQNCDYQQHKLATGNL